MDWEIVWHDGRALKRRKFKADSLYDLEQLLDGTEITSAMIVSITKVPQAW